MEFDGAEVVPYSFNLGVFLVSVFCLCLEASICTRESVLDSIQGQKEFSSFGKMFPPVCGLQIHPYVRS